MKSSPLLSVLILAALGLGCGAQTTEELGVAQRSAFETSVERRDPFLPIGWERPVSVPALAGLKGASAVPTESYLRPEAFVVSSIALDRLPLAVINGKTYGEGDPVLFVAGDKKVALHVEAIRDGVVTLRYNDFKVNCPIRLWQKPAVPGKKP